MTYKFIESSMIAMATSPIFNSIIWKNWKLLNSIIVKAKVMIADFSKLIMPFSDLIQLIGTCVTLITLIYLIKSINDQKRHHNKQMELADKRHNKRLIQAEKQFSVRMSRIDVDDKERYLIRYISAAASNVHYYREHKPFRGAFVFSNLEETQDNFCILLWNIIYKDMSKLDENYIFELYFSMHSIKDTFGPNNNAKSVGKYFLTKYANCILDNRNHDLSFWDHKLVIPRFEGAYGGLAMDDDIRCLNREDIKDMDIYKFACIADAIGKVQILDRTQIVSCNSMARRHKL